MDQVRKNEIIAVVLFAGSLFLFLSLFTFSESDLSFYTSSPNTDMNNVTGILGAFIGGFLRFFLGRASYVIPALILVWGISRLIQSEERKLYFKVFGAIVLCAAVSASLSMFYDSIPEAAYANGGLIGTVIAGFLLEYLGRVGALVFISAMIILSVLVATEFLILPLFSVLFGFVSESITRIRTTLTESIFAKEEDPAVKRSSVREAKKEITKKLEKMKKQVEAVRSTPLSSRKAGSGEEVSNSKTEPRIVSAKSAARSSDRSETRTVQTADTSTGENIEYVLPGLDLLSKASVGDSSEREEVLKQRAAMLENTLMEFGVEAAVVKINRGPVITMYELEPAVGTKVNRITSLSDNISLAMKSANIRIVAPLPGKGTIGIEVPNSKSEKVLLRDILETEEYEEEESPIKLALGKDLSGKTIVIDLAKMPHLLIAGATGSGKTVCINAIISSILFNSSPDEVRFMMIDPKRVELMMFEGIPHLITPIVTNPKKAASALGWIVGEMERRYEIFAGKGVRNIGAYKDRSEEDDENLPYIMVIVDELADLMMVGQQEVETAIMRIAQLSRAAGIHMILATQRPSVNVITGVIKANFPARISFKVASKVDSRTVLDANGAEKLLGRGDMLLMEPGESSLIRGQCSLVEDSEIKKVVKFIKNQTGSQYLSDIMEKQEYKTSGVAHEKDDMYHKAVDIVIGTQQASVSMVQRKLRVGYTRAARMIDMMEEEGIVGPHNGSKAREILIDEIEDIDDTDEEEQEEQDE
ncbi:MAG: DNA translocase FtsK [Candidatus Aadella gelida]|nr:DNA translocase FtsK [Candidatus Aadella gelida]